MQVRISDSVSLSALEKYSFPIFLRAPLPGMMSTLNEIVSNE